MVKTKILAAVIASIIISSACAGVYMTGHPVAPAATLTPAPAVADEPITQTQPTLTVAYLNSEIDPEEKIGYQFNFNVTVQHGSLIYVSKDVDVALAYLVDKYGLESTNFDMLTVRWSALNLVYGTGIFHLFRQTQLSSAQIENLAADLQTSLSTMVKPL